ncbi:MAG: diguanylate cyclase [Pseudomonadota bacterium]
MQVSLDIEYERSQALSIAQRLGADLPARFGAAFFVSALVFASGYQTIALIWISSMIFNEFLELKLANYLRNSSRLARTWVLLYAAHLGLGSSIWAGLGIALWNTNEGALLVSGALILLGSIVHITMIYSVSKLQVSIALAPQVISILALLTSSWFDDQFVFQDKAIVSVFVCISLIYLVALLKHSIETQERLSNLARSNQKYASEDALTGLSNRRVFIERLNEQVTQDASTGLLFIDLDHFKPLNDEYGHAIGDEVLTAVSNRLKTIPETICAARLGGDEFGLIYNDSKYAASNELRLTKLHSALTRPIKTTIGDVQIGASIGYAGKSNNHCDAAQIMHAADIAMLRAKSMGGGFAKFDFVQDQALLNKQAIEASIRKDVTEGRVDAILFPIESLQTGKTVSFELSPQLTSNSSRPRLTVKDTTAVLERLGLVNRVLFSALSILAPKIANSSFKIAINVSPSQLLSSSFFKELSGVLNEHDLKPSQFELEVTEQVCERHEGDCVRVLRQAQASGFSIVLDDFGARSSSIWLFDRLPLSKVKLSRELVDICIRNQRKKQLLLSTISLVKSMGLACIAECALNEDTRRLLIACRCDEIQSGNPYKLGSKTELSHAV